jgi:hypothetical protein
MEPLISACNQLREVLKPVGNYSVTLPWVVAVGGQSSGKSSVLENIVGRCVLVGSLRGANWRRRWSSLRAGAAREHGATERAVVSLVI